MTLFQAKQEITFTSPDPATLTITVARQREGKPSSTEFRYKRIDARQQ